MSKLNVVIGYDKGAAKLTSFENMFIAGLTGSGKSVYLRSVISSILLLNKPDDFSLHLYNRTTMKYKVGNLSNYESIYKEDVKENNKAVLADAKNTLESRMNLIRNGDVEEGTFKKVIYVFDDVLWQITNDTESCQILNDLITYGNTCGIYLVITSQSHIDFGAVLIDKIPVKVLLRSTAEASEAIIGSEIAASDEFKKKRLIAIKSRGNDTIRVYETYIVTEEQSTSISHIVSHF